uniref:Uncharacterized protein n=1 Tax=Arundo donax TaxID=35708 RepID=A0A0A9AMC9_ARUDO
MIESHRCCILTWLGC